jgi:hypothetical protein
MDENKSVLENLTDTVKNAATAVVEGAKSIANPASGTDPNMPPNESGAEITQAAERRPKKRAAKKAPPRLARKKAAPKKATKRTATKKKAAKAKAKTSKKKKSKR